MKKQLKLDGLELTNRFGEIIERVNINSFFRELLFEDIFFGVVTSLDIITLDEYLLKLKALGKETVDENKLLKDMREIINSCKTDYKSLEEIKEEFLTDKFCRIFSRCVKTRGKYYDCFPTDYPQKLKIFIQQIVKRFIGILATAEENNELPNQLAEIDSEVFSVLSKCIYYIVIGKKKLDKHSAQILNHTPNLERYRITRFLEKNGETYKIKSVGTEDNELQLAAIELLSFNQKEYSMCLHRMLK